MFKKITATILAFVLSLAITGGVAFAAAPSCVKTQYVAAGATKGNAYTNGAKVVVGDNATVDVSGNNDCVVAGNNDTLHISGNGVTVTAGTGTIAHISGNAVVVIAQGGSYVLTGNKDVLTLSGAYTVSNHGNGNKVNGVLLV